MTRWIVSTRRVGESGSSCQGEGEGDGGVKLDWRDDQRSLTLLTVYTARPAREGPPTTRRCVFSITSSEQSTTTLQEDRG